MRGVEVCLLTCEALLYEVDRDRRNGKVKLLWAAGVDMTSPSLEEPMTTPRSQAGPKQSIASEASLRRMPLGAWWQL